jgi:hypothetical protein
LQVTHPHLRKPGDLCCHKCGASNKLSGNGLRQGTRTVLFMNTQVNPHTVADTLQKELPGVEVKMDVGHVLFSRLNPSFDKKHPQYCKSCLPPD